ncbi:hypothetical protein ACFOY2_49035 [Nonomuraea purpurea]|uniref:Lipoprotein n=1 Tax=Nonomuraea purpurea TaxID=1849276 RepID=A0ABV8GQF7_9ACTN
MRSSLVLSALSLAALAGCGSATASGAGTPAVDGQGRVHKVQSLKADCMKQKGFRYVPFVYPGPVGDEEKALTGDYAAMKAERGKHGFGVFAHYVYRNLAKPDKPDPNMDIYNRLSTAQRKPYTAANEACEMQATKQVTGKDVKSFRTLGEQYDQRLTQAKTRELDGDPRLVELGSAMADCLAGKGYRVSSTKPTLLATRGRAEFEKRRAGMADDSGDMSGITADQARPHLGKEIKAALDDLECGRRFYPVFAPKERAVERTINDEFGMPSL